MARQFTNSSANNNRKPFCKVCADAGKSDTAHFPRKTLDLNSQVICPTLLALECRYCFKNGHTVKYCSVLKQRNAQDLKDRNRDNKDNIKDKDRVVIPQKPINKFSALLEEEDLAEAVEKAVEIATNGLVVKRDMDFPESLSKKTNVIHITSNNNNNWALMASNASALALPKVTITIPLKPVVITHKVNTQWADDSEDEIEEEEDEEPTPLPQQQYVANYNVYEDEW